MHRRQCGGECGALAQDEFRCSEMNDTRTCRSLSVGEARSAVRTEDFGLLFGDVQ